MIQTQFEQRDHVEAKFVRLCLLLLSLAPLKLLTASKHLKRLVIPDFSSCFCFYQLTSFPKSKLVSIGKEDSMGNGGHYVNPDVEEGEQAHDAPML